jgi:hypothetical protein
MDENTLIAKIAHMYYVQDMDGNNPEADLSIRTNFTREDFGTMNDFKEVADLGYSYTNR